jgi:hypothetical protein
VALTRAQDGLILTRGIDAEGSWAVSDDADYFLSEMPSDLVTEVEVVQPLV